MVSEPYRPWLPSILLHLRCQFLLQLTCLLMKIKPVRLSFTPQLLHQFNWCSLWVNLLQSNSKTKILSWKQQILTAIWGYGLEDFIIGGAIIPPQFITDDSGVQIYNPTFVAHQRKISYCHLGCSSISSTLLPHLVGHDSARGIWEVVNQLFAAPSTLQWKSTWWKWKRSSIL